MMLVRRMIYTENCKLVYKFWKPAKKQSVVFDYQKVFGIRVYQHCSSEAELINFSHHIIGDAEAEEI